MLDFFTNDNNIESIDCPATEREREIKKSFTLKWKRAELLKRNMQRNLKTGDCVESRANFIRQLKQWDELLNYGKYYRTNSYTIDWH